MSSKLHDLFTGRAFSPDAHDTRFTIAHRFPKRGRFLWVLVSKGVCQLRIVTTEKGVPVTISAPKYEPYEGPDVLGGVVRGVKSASMGQLDSVSQPPSGVVISLVPSVVSIGSGWPAFAVRPVANGHQEADDAALWAAQAKDPLTALTGVSDVSIPETASYVAITSRGFMRTFVAQFPKATLERIAGSYSDGKGLPPLVRMQVLPASILRYFRDHKEHSLTLTTHSLLVYGAGVSFMVVTGSESGGGEWLLASSESQVVSARSGQRPGDALVKFVDASFQSVTFAHNTNLLVVRIGVEDFDKQLLESLPQGTEIRVADKDAEIFALFND